jgi:hypothetical protein
MKFKPLLHLIAWLFTGILFFSSCTAIIEPNISNRAVIPEAPGDGYQSVSYTMNFWWDPVGDALTYHLQVVTPSFNNPGGLALDTVVKKNTFAVNLKPGSYQWRVMAVNGSSQTPYSTPKGFTILASSIKQQSVQLTSPANNTLTNQGSLIFAWGNLYGATKYQLQMDTNNFLDTTKLVYNQTIPAQQVTFSFPKDQVYQWRVRAQNDTAKALWSAVNTLTYDHTPPARVSIVAPANNQTLPLPVSLQWNAAASAVKYKLYAFKGDSTTVYSAIFPVSLNTTSYSFSAGSTGDRVYWRVTAIDAAGNESQPSGLRSFLLQ